MKIKFRKCPVCGKALRSQNKIGICGIHSKMEYERNFYTQIRKYEK